jgi:hypothetical protein
MECHDSKPSDAPNLDATRRLGMRPDGLRLAAAPASEQGACRGVVQRRHDPAASTLRGKNGDRSAVHPR